MMIDLISQAEPYFWALSAMLVPSLAVLLFAGLEPELAEVYLGESHLLAAAVAIAVIGVALAGQLSHALP
jgi:hypothetical protein